MLSVKCAHKINESCSGTGEARISASSGLKHAGDLYYDKEGDTYIHNCD